jgi:hypothetical protein
MNGKTVIQVVVGVALASSAAAAFDTMLSAHASPVARIQGEAAAQGGTLAFLLPPHANRFIVSAGGFGGGATFARNIMP